MPIPWTLVWFGVLGAQNRPAPKNNILVTNEKQIPTFFREISNDYLISGYCYLCAALLLVELFSLLDKKLYK